MIKGVYLHELKNIICFYKTIRSVIEVLRKKDRSTILEASQESCVKTLLTMQASGEVNVLRINEKK